LSLLKVLLSISQQTSLHSINWHSVFEYLISVSSSVPPYFEECRFM